MKIRCYNCKAELDIKPFERLRAVECPECRRQVFRNEKVWGGVWAAFVAICAVTAGVIVFLATAKVGEAWSAYLIFLVPAAVAAVLAPLGNFLIVFIYKGKNR